MNHIVIQCPAIRNVAELRCNKTNRMANSRILQQKPSKTHIAYAHPLNNGDIEDPQKTENHSNPLSGSIFDRHAIGAEYGEGFLQFRRSGEKIRLDVDILNEQLSIRGADRIRHTMRPDEAFGLIFTWEDVIIDARSLQLNAWKLVAAAESLPFPSLHRPHMLDVRPERAAMDILQWTRDMKRAKELAWLVAIAYSELLEQVQDPLPGVKEWLAIMNKTNIPCSLVTAMDRRAANSLLDKLDLRSYFSATVTADDDMETLAQRYLSAAIKLHRPPNHCVVFSASPTGVAAAHNCTMRAIAVIGRHTAPQLRAADLTVGDLMELSVYNLRRLFANRGQEHMDLKKNRIGKGPGKRLQRNALLEN